MAKKKAAQKKARAPRVERPYPRTTLEDAIRIPMAIRHKNGGNPWEPTEIAKALNMAMANNFYYLSAASRDYGLTVGTRDASEISLTPLGRRLAYAETPEDERETRVEAFLLIDIFREVLEYYKGAELPEMKYLANTLENKFGLHPSIHEEFATLFRSNCEDLSISEGVEESVSTPLNGSSSVVVTSSMGSDFVTVAEPDEDNGLVCFVAMPFSERQEQHPKGFFSEVLKRIIAPAGREAGFRVVTARKKGSDIIHATIVNGLLDADLVVADLTEHNPNVLFELGIRMAADKCVALIRAEGTPGIFDVDHMLRVEDYNPCLWPSTVEKDLPKIKDHISGAWNGRDNSQTYMGILRSKQSE